MRQDMSQAERQALTDEMNRLREEHRDLDDATQALEAMERPDRLQIQRLKKRKLLLRDQIVALSSKLTPDIIA